MSTLKSALCATLLVSTASIQASRVWVVNLTDKPVTSVTFLVFHKNAKAEIVVSLDKNGTPEKREFTNIAPWSKTDGQSIESTLSKVVIGQRGSKPCNIQIATMKPSSTILIQENPYKTQFFLDCDEALTFMSNLIVWGNCTLIIENDPTTLEKITKKVSHFKMKLENNSPYDSNYLSAKNDEKPIGNWASKVGLIGHLKKKASLETTEPTTNS